MRTVGEILIEARNSKKLSLDQVAKETKIRKKILEILEQSNWNLLGPTYTKGLLKNYATYLGLDEKRILAFFRREYDEKKETKTAKRLDRFKPKFHFTPGVITASLILIIVIAVFIYLFYQYQSFTSAPKLEIQEPKNNLKTSTLEVSVIGKTWSDAILKINGEKVQVSPGGTFSVSVSLKEGVNKLIITAENKFGKINTDSRTVFVTTPKKQIELIGGEQNILTLQLKVINRPTFLKVLVDEKILFEGLMIAGSDKIFEAKKKIKIITEDGGSTVVKIGDQETTLGKK